MTSERTTGLILRTRPLTETSLIVQWLTADWGRIATVAKGARRPNSPFRGKLDLYFTADFSFHRSRKSELHILRETVLRDAREPLRKEMAYLQQAAYGVALIEQTTETETPLPRFFALFSSLLDHLPRQTPQPLTVFALEMKLLEEIGQQPDLAEAALSEGAKKILQHCLDLDWLALARLKLSPAQTSELNNFLRDFLSFHLGRLPNGRSPAVSP